jgi:alanine-glyoxylate transaminase/serine-glyoxylate transaminase/serine-pyruvate transaminase
MATTIPHLSLNPPVRTLLGPGPSSIHPRVQMAMSAPLVGHLDPYFTSLMDDFATPLHLSHQE